MSAVETERPLIEQAQKGDRQAFSLLVRHHQAVVRAYVAVHIRDSATADDLAQEIFLIAYRRLHTFDLGRALRPWLIGMARLRVLEYLREDARNPASSHRSVDKAIDECSLERVESETDPVEREVELLALQKCIDGLPPGSSGLVRRHYLQAETLTSIAQAENRKESAVRMQLLRVREALRDCVQKRLAAEGA